MDFSQFQPATPWDLPAREECTFYHSFTFPDGEEVKAEWDLRGCFDSYIGSYPIAGKTLLDVGAASGFLSLSAEKAGALVTSLDARAGSQFLAIPHAGTMFHNDRYTYVRRSEESLKRSRNAYWYSWNKFNSKNEMIYAEMSLLPFWGRKFDVVLAGAIIEHLSDPITMIGNMAQLAKEAFILAGTAMFDSNEMIMRAGPNWLSDAPGRGYTWWLLSRGLYQQVLTNLGFEVEFVDAYAIPLFSGSTEKAKLNTIIARRVRQP